MLQVKEYQNCAERVEVLGVVGINGSPSCGIEYTFSADWGGELSSQPNLEAYLKKGERKEAMGIFMQVLKEMLEEERNHSSDGSADREDTGGTGR